MISMDSAGTTERMASRISFSAARAGAGAAAMYCSTVVTAECLAELLFATAAFLPAVLFFAGRVVGIVFLIMCEMLNEALCWPQSGRSIVSNQHSAKETARQARKDLT